MGQTGAGEANVDLGAAALRAAAEATAETAGTSCGLPQRMEQLARGAALLVIVLGCGSLIGRVMGLDEAGILLDLALMPVASAFTFILLGLTLLRGLARRLGVALEVQP